jgi:undecaprenyl-diphosphatase
VSPSEELSDRSHGALRSFDDAVDALFEPLRGRPGLDIGARVLSNLADYGAVWAALAGAKGRRRGPRRRRATVSLAVAGFSSLGVNAAVKAVVKRQRPPESPSTDGGLPVRTPTSTSFPSGHTLAAFCTAVVLAESPAEAAAYLGFATAVAASRVHLRAHHASDVVGGAVIGAALGSLGRRLLSTSRNGPRRPGV